MIKASCWTSSAALTIALAICLPSANAAATPMPSAGKTLRLSGGSTGVMPSVGMGGATLAGQVARSAPRLQTRFSRSEFMEDTPREIAMENRANPWQAWALAFFPTAIIKGLTLGLAFAKADSEQWAVFLPMVPSMGLSHFWETKFYWAGFIALAGDIAGSSLVTYYWSKVYSAPTVAARPEQTMLWAGIGVLAVFWIYEMITAPLFASWHNGKLRDQFIPAEKTVAAGPSWRNNPWPNTGISQIGPPIHQPIPIAAGYTFSF